MDCFRVFSSIQWKHGQLRFYFYSFKIFVHQINSTNSWLSKVIVSLEANETLNCLIHLSDHLKKTSKCYMVCHCFLLLMNPFLSFLKTFDLWDGMRCYQIIIDDLLQCVYNLSLVYSNICA